MTHQGGRSPDRATTLLPRDDQGFIKVSIRAVDPPHMAWTAPVDVYFKRTGGSWKLVGVERTTQSR